MDLRPEGQAQSLEAPVMFYRGVAVAVALVEPAVLVVLLLCRIQISEIGRYTRPRQPVYIQATPRVHEHGFPWDPVAEGEVPLAVRDLAAEVALDTWSYS